MQIATFTSRRCTEMGDVELRFYEILIREEIENLCENGRFLQMVSYIQHGDISVFEHLSLIHI